LYFLVIDVVVPDPIELFNPLPPKRILLQGVVLLDIHVDAFAAQEQVFALY
jgi:hypothetical protein